MYLASIDPQGRTIDEHICEIIIFCSVHFHRSIKRICEPLNDYPLSVKMLSLAHVQTVEEYDALCNELART